MTRSLPPSQTEAASSRLDDSTGPCPTFPGALRDQRGWISGPRPKMPSTAPDPVASRHKVAALGRQLARRFHGLLLSSFCAPALRLAASPPAPLQLWLGPPFGFPWWLGCFYIGRSCPITCRRSEIGMSEVISGDVYEWRRQWTLSPPWAFPEAWKRSSRRSPSGGWRGGRRWRTAGAGRTSRRRSG
jgi:hypothetical protein